MKKKKKRTNKKKEDIEEKSMDILPINNTSDFSFIHSFMHTSIHSIHLEFSKTNLPTYR